MNRLLFFSLSFIWINVSQSQPTPQTSVNDTANFPFWIEMMQDPDANFYETQRAFNMYWENREVTRGSGWKPFKRWEYYMGSRVDAQGHKPQSDQLLRAYDFVKNQSETRSPSGNWKIVGPTNLPVSMNGQPNGLGRINVVAFHPTNENVIYIGAPSGGLWKSTDHGQTWKNTTDRMPTLGVSAIAVNPADANIVYMGTGDRDANDAEGMGVFISYDGGESWSQSNSGMRNATVNKLLVNPKYPEIVLAATSSGIYMSTNSGQNWVLKTSGTVKSMEFKPNNPDVVYAIKGGSFYKSTDGGENWALVPSSPSAWNRAVLGVTPANPELVYILATNTRSFRALYLSTDSGDNFTIMSTTPNIMGYTNNGSDDGGQAWYDLCMAIDPLNSGTVYAGGVNIFKSTNFGATWKINAHWVGSGAPAVHADHHDLALNPLNNTLYTGNDGGIYYTKNGGSSWLNISNGLAISQIYKLSQSQTQREMIMCGNQDNGTSLWSDGSWKAVIGGDGMECIIDPTDHRYKYGSLYYGSLYRSTNDASYQTITNSISEEGAWVSPYVLSPSDPRVLYLGLVNLWRTSNARATTPVWKNITASLGFGNTISALDCSPANSAIVYFATDDPKIYRTTNANATTPQWTKITSLGNTKVNDIKANPTNQNIVYLVGANNNVYRSDDMGNNWNNISAGLPSISLNCIAIDKNSNEGLYLGTDMGVFYKDATMAKWQYYSTGLPATSRITEIEIYYNQLNGSLNALRASTYGRGTWESDLYSEPVTQANSARLVNLKAPIGTFNPSDLVSPELEIRNIGYDTLKSCRMLYIVDQFVMDTIDYSGLLSTHQNDIVKFPGIRHLAGQHSFTTTIFEVNGQPFSEQISSTFNISAKQSFMFTLTTDSLASETTWQIEDTTGNSLLSSSAYANDSVYFDTTLIDLEAGCYRIIIKDENGICCTNGNGEFTLKRLADAYTLGQGASFTTSDTIEFCVDTLPTPDFYAFSAFKVGDEITFTNKTNNPQYQYYWSFGSDASPSYYSGEAPPKVVYSSEGPKTISLTAKNKTASSVMVKQDYLSVYAEPVITNQPKSIEICPNNTAIFKVTTTGYNVSYQWYFNDESLNNQFYPALTIENVSASDAGKYYCRISSPKWTVYSDTVSLNLLETPKLELSASNNSVCTGTEVTLTATSDANVTWGNNLGTGNDKTVTPITSTVYTATANNTICSTTREISISVSLAPKITQNPESKIVCEGKAVSFIAGASGNNLTYNWTVNATSFNNASNLLNISNAKLEYAGNVICKVENTCGFIESEPVKLTVNPLPTANYTVQITGNTAEFTNTAINAKSYEWDFGDGQLSQLIQPTHVYENGTYSVEQRAFNDCGSDTLATSITIGQSNLDDLSENEKLAVYPNPSNGLIHISVYSPSMLGDVQISLINIEGKMVETITVQKNENEKVVPVNLTSYPKGIYQLVITNNHRIFTRRIVME